jgi:hypothetical protein
MAANSSGSHINYVAISSNLYISLDSKNYKNTDKGEFHL